MLGSGVCLSEGHKAVFITAAERTIQSTENTVECHAVPTVLLVPSVVLSLVNVICTAQVAPYRLLLSNRKLRCHITGPVTSAYSNVTI